MKSVNLFFGNIELTLLPWHLFFMQPMKFLSLFVKRLSLIPMSSLWSIIVTGYQQLTNESLLRIFTYRHWVEKTSCIPTFFASRSLDCDLTVTVLLLISSPLSKDRDKEMLDTIFPARTRDWTVLLLLSLSLSKDMDLDLLDTIFPAPSKTMPKAEWLTRQNITKTKTKTALIWMFFYS